MRSKLLIVNTLYYPNHIGGAELSVQTIAEGVKDVYEVSVLTVALDNKYKREVVNGVNVYRIPTYGFKYGNYPKNMVLKLMWHLLHNFNPVKDYFLKKVINRIKPDLIHTNNVLGLSTIIWKVGKKKHIPIIHTLRDRGLLCPWHMLKNGKVCNKQCRFCKTYTVIRKKHSINVDCLVSISNDIKKSYLGEGYFYKNKKSIIIYNGVEDRLCHFEKTINKEIKFGYLGTISIEKGVDVLIDTFNTLCGYSLFIAGDNTTSRSLEIIKKCINKDVVFLGKVNGYEFLKSIDVLIVPSSFREPFGRVVIEAFSLGIPVIVSNHGAFPEIVIENKTGWFFEASNSNDLKETIIRISNLSEEDRRQIGLNCRKEYEAKYTQEHVLNEYLKLYRGLIKC
nr:glycosyltransferase family 4 protein [uncultured Carboxylicivirga sp.]